MGVSLNNLPETNLLKGSIEDSPLAFLLGTARVWNVTGTLSLRRDNANKQIYCQLTYYHDWLMNPRNKNLIHIIHSQICEVSSIYPNKRHADPLVSHSPVHHWHYNYNYDPLWKD